MYTNVFSTPAFNNANQHVRPPTHMAVVRCPVIVLNAAVRRLSLA